MSSATDREALVAEVKPEFRPHGAEDDCDLNPEFAVICSFIANFSDLLDVTLNIDQLKYSIEDQSYLDDDLIDLHVKLLKKVRRYFVRDQWEKALIRFTSEYSYEDAYELETLGYQKTRPSIKLTLLRRLLEAQFECDQKFKASVNLGEADKLRNSSIGRDIQGNTYWHSVDTEGNFKIYQEEPLNYKSWRTICSKPEELEKLINDLETKKEERVKGEPILEPYNPLPDIFPEFFCKKEKLEEVSENDDINTVDRKTKGRNNRNNNKKTNSLPAVKEVEEEDGNSINSSNNTRRNCLGHKTDDGDTNRHNGIQKLSPIKPPSPVDDCSNESTQIKSTVENLLNKVVSSLDFIIRPLTKSPSLTESTNNKPQLDNNNKLEVKSQKKRTTKKERIKEEILPRRSSSRIQQLQMKKIAEQEEEMKKKLESKSKINLLDDDSRSQSSTARNSKKRSESPDDQSKTGRRKRCRGQTWRRGKGKKKLAWNEDDSDLSSTSTLTESNDDELDDEEISFKFDTNYDDEFACEDEETNNNEPVIVKRARTARQSLGLDEQNDLNSSSILEEDKPCGRCDKSHDPEWILLCDMCDDGYHASCCLPPLMIIPDGDWFCPPCEHKTLLSKLVDLKTSINQTLEAKERERVKNQRLRQTTIKKELIKIEEFDEEIDESDDDVELDDNTSDESFKATSASEVEEDDISSDSDTIIDDDISSGSETSIDELIDLKRFKSKRRYYSDGSDGSDSQPTRSRRAASKKVNYKESTDDEDTESFKDSSKGKKNILSSDSETEASWKSHDSTPVSRSTPCPESPKLNIDEATEESQTDLKEPIDSGVSSARTDIAVSTVAEPVRPSSSPPPPPPPSISPPTSPVTYAELEVRPKSTVKDSPLPINNTMLKVGLEKVCDPIQELNQYCSESANSTSMFNSYIETLLSKNSPPHPTFYEEDEVKPP